VLNFSRESIVENLDLSALLQSTPDLVRSRPVTEAVTGSDLGLISAEGFLTIRLDGLSAIARAVPR
jgi:hypothetical protein